MSLATDEAGLLLRKVLMAKGGSNPILDSMNHFYSHRLPQILKAYHIETIDGKICKFITPVFFRPDINDVRNQGKPRPLWPSEARRKQLSYMAKMSATLQMYEKNPDGTLRPTEAIQVYLGKLPVMIGSELCRTFGLSEDEKYAKGEPKKDCLAYFIIKGTEKVFLNIEKLRTKVTFLYEEKEKFHVLYTSETLTETTLVVVKGEPYSVNVSFDRIGGKSGPGINVFSIFHLLGLGENTVGQALQIMDHFIVDDDPQREVRRRRELRTYLQSTASVYQAETRGSTDQIIANLSRMLESEKLKNVGNRDEMILTTLQTELFRNIPMTPQTKEAALLAKIRLLAYMVVKYVEFMNGYRTSDDRDFWGNKRLDDAAKHISTRFHQIWKGMISDLDKKVKAKQSRTVAHIKADILPNTMETQFISYYTKEGMGIGPQGKKDVVKVDILKRDTLLASFAHVRRVNTPTSRRAKIRAKRLINNTQWGVICNIMTPEGENCLEVSTPVLMADGTWKPIGTLKDGDEVVTIDPKTKQQNSSTITRYFIRDVEAALTVTTTSKSAICTPDHRFLTKKGWIEAQHLKANDLVSIYSGKKLIWEKVVSVTSSGPCKVADFTTDSRDHSMVSGGFVTHNCGLVKDAALSTYVSLSRDPDILRKKLDGRYTTFPSEGKRNPLFLNGICLGFCDTKAIRTYLLELRRSMQQIFFDTGVVLNQYNELFVFTDDGRVCRPLLLVDPVTQTLLIDQKKLRNEPLSTLLDQGAIEYIDVAEQEQTQILIAKSDRDLRKEIDDLNETIRENQRILSNPQSTPDQIRSAQIALGNVQALQKYTHCEVDPTSIMGISASIIPFPEFNPAPRLTYQSSMGKQALGPNSSRVELRYDTTTRLLLEPGVPSIATDAHEWLGLDEFPGGKPAIVAVTTYGGGNQEDAIIMNKGAVDRGYFMMMIYHSYTEKVCNQKKNIREEIKIPDHTPDKAPRYAKLDPSTGIVRLNEYVTEGDCLVGKVATDTITRKVTNTSLFVDVNKNGRVDGIFITDAVDSCKLIRIRLREMRKPQVGDKFASRYSQKGTIGELIPEEDMPFVVSPLPELNGVIPHMIFNPHGIPSRMTIGKLMEMIAGMYASITGTRINATAFRRYDVRTHMQLLEAMGFSSKGKYQMRNGRTGREFDVEIFLGPVYYQLLRHLVQDKMQARGTGAVQFATRQPVPGIRREGGLRLGEMERDALIQHGAAYLLQERMSISSDAWQGIVCKDCGQLAIHQIERGEFKCPHCVEGEFRRIQIPYAMKLYIHLLAALNIGVKLRPA